MDVEPLQAGDGALVERASAMTAAGSDVAIGLTRTTPPPPDEREYDVPVGARSLKVRWTDAGLEATAPTRTSVLPTRFRLRLEDGADGPVLRGTATNASPRVWLVLLAGLAAWFVVQLVGALGDGSTARTLTAGVVLATCLVGIAVVGTPRSTRHVRTLDLVDLATALWEREPAGRRPRTRRRARP